MAELWDVLDKNGNRTGRTIVRGNPLGPGEYHLIVHIWIRNEYGEYLIQKRADHLELLPGMWATTGGSVVAGEESRPGAVRETREEIGLTLDPASLTLLSRVTGADRIADVWLAEAKKADAEGTLLGEEVSDIRWATKDAIKRLIEAGEFHDYGYIDRLLP